MNTLALLLLSHVLAATIVIDRHPDNYLPLPDIRPTPPTNPPPNTVAAMKSISSGGMTVQWRVEGAMLHCQMSAPTQGWLAIGFNTRDQLMNTNLIMGCVQRGAQQSKGQDVVRVSDRFIVAPGLHKSISELNGTEEISNVHGMESLVDGRTQTTISFSMPLHAHDTKHHQILAEGQQYTLLMAYSMEDDFQHHSTMRTSVPITL
jgi:hypothetical protein